MGLVDLSYRFSITAGRSTLVTVFESHPERFWDQINVCTHSSPPVGILEQGAAWSTSVCYIYSQQITYWILKRCRHRYYHSVC